MLIRLTSILIGWRAPGGAGGGVAELEKYFKKYKLVLLDENYIDSEKVIYVNNKQKFD